MTIAEVALKYAKALFHLTSSKEQLESRLVDLKQIEHVITQKPQLRTFFSSPQISQEKKEKVLQNSLGSHIDSQLLSFCTLLLEKRRFKYFSEIVKKYEKMVMAKLDLLEGRLITAMPIDAELKAKVQQVLEKRYQKKVILKDEVNPHLLGGGILLIDNQQLDFSIRGKLNRLKDDLLSIRDYTKIT